MSLEAFLADLDDLEEDADGAPDEGAEDNEVNCDGVDYDDDIDMMGNDDGIEQRVASGLLMSARMVQLMRHIDVASARSTVTVATSTADIPATAADEGGDEDEDAESQYALMVNCNEMVIDIDHEIDAIAKTIKDEYARRFPELDSLILNPLDYARVVLKLGNEIDMSEVDLTGILPSATIMVVTVTASTTTGTQLPPATLAAVTESCEQVLSLHDNKMRMLAYVESNMNRVAPNLSNLVGTAIAAKLIGAAGGMDKLAALPSTTLQILGSKKKSLGGMSTTTQVVHGGFIAACDLVQNTPPALRNKVLRLVAGKGTLAARVDTFADKGRGTVGQGFRDEIEARATKLQEPPPPKAAKALPAPIESSGKRRGGRRLRKMKERYGMSQMRQLANRVRFGEEEDTTSDGMLGVGMLSKGQQTGKVRVTAKDQKLLAEKNKKQRSAGSSGASNGLASSLAFTPVQGIELVNPSQKQDSKEGTETYFSKQVGQPPASMAHAHIQELHAHAVT